MKGLAQRTIASVAILATLTLATPALAMATPSTTTTVAAKTQVIVTMQQYRTAKRLYDARLKSINLTFLAVVKTARTNLVNSLRSATNSSQRISARATYRFAITEATVARSSALTLLGNPPVKPFPR